MHLNRFSLLVKGSMHDALQAAADRGFRVNGVELQMGAATRLDASHDASDAAGVWLGEPGRPIAGEGFPPGTLLHYSYR